MPPSAKIKASKFVDHIAILAVGCTDRIVSGFQGQCTEKEFLKMILLDTQELIEHNEWTIGIENLMSNLHEIDFKVDMKAIELAKEAIEESKLNYDEYKFFEELLK